MAKTLTIKTKLDTGGFDNQIAKMTYEVEKLEEELDAIEKANPYATQQDDILEYKSKIEKLTNSIEKMKEKQNKDSGKLIDTNSIVSGMQNILKTVSMWGLAVIGVRSAYSAIRQAISTCSQYNEQMSADLEYMQYALASAIMPVVQSIVNFIFQLLQGINYVSKTLFGIDLFANATASGFKNANSEAKKLSNTLSSYDTANVLSDSSSSASSSGSLSPSIDLSQPDKEVEGFLDRIADGWEQVGNDMKDSLGDIGTYFDAFGGWGLTIWGLVDVFYGLWEVVQGFIDFVVGIFQMLVGALTGNEELIAEGWENTWNGLCEFFKGIWDTFVGIVTTVVGIVVGLVSELVSGIVGMVQYFWKTFCDILGAIGNWVYKNVITPVANFFSGLWNGIINGLKSMWNRIKSFASTAFSYISKFASMVKSVLLAPINLIIDGLNTLINGINKISFDVPEWVPIIGNQKWGFNIPNIPKLATGAIINKPGTGVPVGMAGEAGREGLLPLTDERAMAQLGEEIGKHISLTVDLINKIDSRVLSKQMLKIQNDNEFARNGG